MCPQPSPVKAQEEPPPPGQAELRICAEAAPAAAPEAHLLLDAPLSPHVYGIILLYVLCLCLCVCCLFLCVDQPDP